MAARPGSAGAERRATGLPASGAASRPRAARLYALAGADLEDLCDRLTDNPFVDASDIEVGIAGTEVTLNGTVNDPIALRQAQAIAEEVAGVTHVHNRLRLRTAGERETTPGDAVNAALGTGKR